MIDLIILFICGIRAIFKYLHNEINNSNKIKKQYFINAIRINNQLTGYYLFL